MIGPLLLATLWFVTYITNNTTFEHALIGLAFTGVLALSSIHDAIKEVRCPKSVGSVTTERL
jgi:hypothetical protein